MTGPLKVRKMIVGNLFEIMFLVAMLGRRKEEENKTVARQRRKEEAETT